MKHIELGKILGAGAISLTYYKANEDNKANTKAFLNASSVLTWEIISPIFPNSFNELFDIPSALINVVFQSIASNNINVIETFLVSLGSSNIAGLINDSI